MTADGAVVFTRFFCFVTMTESWVRAKSWLSKLSWPLCCHLRRRKNMVPAAAPASTPIPMPAPISPLVRPAQEAAHRVPGQHHNLILVWHRRQLQAHLSMLTCTSPAQHACNTNLNCSLPGLEMIGNSLDKPEPDCCSAGVPEPPTPPAAALSAVIGLAAASHG